VECEGQVGTGRTGARVWPKRGGGGGGGAARFENEKWGGAQNWGGGYIAGLNTALAVRKGFGCGAVVVH
jgi:hypothetical protein